MSKRLDKNAERKMYMEVIKEPLEDMAKDGTMKEISEKWFGEDVTTIGK